jgi:hypothetical protein
LQQQVATMRSINRKNPEEAALIDLCQQLLASNEFLYVD